MAIKYQAPVTTGGRAVLMLFFWIWGLLGLLINGGEVLSLHGDIGVGTSAYLLVGEMLWIGGMIFFGLAALFLPPKTIPADVVEPDKTTPEKTRPLIEWLDRRPGASSKPDDELLIRARAIGPQPGPLPMKVCPHCVAVIPLEALACRHCARDVNTTAEVEVLCREQLQRDIAEHRRNRGTK